MRANELRCIGASLVWYVPTRRSPTRYGCCRVFARRNVLIKNEVAHFVAVRHEVELGAGENIDMKQFEAGMRALLDTYIQADPSEVVATFEKGLVDLIVERGERALNAAISHPQES